MVLITIAYVVVQEMVARLAVLHRQGPGRTHPRGVPPAADGLRRHRLRHRQHRPHGDRVRRDRHRVRPLRRLALPLRPDRRGRHLVARALRVLPLRRAGLPAPDRRLHRLPHRRRARHIPTGSRWRPTPCGPTSSPASRSSCSPSPSSAPPSRPTSSSTRREPWSTRASSPRSTASSGSTPSSAPSWRRSSPCRSSWPPAPPSGAPAPHLGLPRRRTRSSPVAGAAAETLFGLGLLGASALAAAVVPLSTSYAVAEAIGVERSVSSSFRQAPVFLGLFTAPDPGRRGRGPGAGQPDHPDPQHPGPRGRDHPHDARS